MSPASATLSAPSASGPAATYEPFKVSIEQFTRFRRDGFVVIPGLVPPADIAELRAHTEELMQGRLPEQRPDTPEKDRLPAPPAHLSPAEKAQFVARIHMLHRQLPLHERYLLHPRVLDVLETLIGPDILALQTMLFLKPPGSEGQGWHQDTYYIPTHPDTLCGAWIAIDEVDEFNGAMWMAAGSNVEPVFPPRVEKNWYGDRHLPGVPEVDAVSVTDDAINQLSPVAEKYPQLLVPAKPGDVVFFGGHILHRSKRNVSTDRFRRSFVSHYCNARSFTQWGAVTEGPQAGPQSFDPLTRMSNGSHILARGDTHLPYAQPRFGTPCAALEDPVTRRENHRFIFSAMGNAGSGDMEKKPAVPDEKH
ncbi:MAG: phytanoyl-CoA dioxygenase family protein [Opitutaceae bacterium]|nr:phytanoyl-CoA dioxygenase family protein [Opitutaceae bacterium]MBP9912287.1 phytanoyl-CoA dioxygenase family protein [Opitutaceae bacterium]